MKRWEYSGGWKALALILNQICAVILTLSVLICTLYAGNSGLSMLGHEDCFENTTYYQSETTIQIQRCIRAVSRESKFERNGVYDGKMAVDIHEYAQSKKILQGKEEEGSLCYRLSDLLNWSLDGYEERTLLRITYADGRVGYITQGEVSQTDSAGAVQNVEQIPSVVESYAPLGYASIADYAEKQKLSAEELTQVYLDLVNTISFIYNDYYAYKENLELFSPGMTNIRYMVIPAEVEKLTVQDFEQKTYTNLKSLSGWKVEKPEDIQNRIRTYRSYLIFNSSDMSFESSHMPMSLSEISSYLKDYPPSVNGDYTLIVAIDPEYQASDLLQTYKKQYEEVRPLSRMAVYGALLGALLYLLSLVYLTLAAGRGTDGEDREIHVNGFDRIKTELAVLLLVIPSVLVLGAGMYLKPAMDGVTEACVWGGCLIFGLNLLFLAGYLSLVRRMKSHTLWRNSVLCALVRMVSVMFQNRKATTRVSVLYLLYLLINFVLLWFGLLGLFLAAVFDLAVGIFLLQQVLQRQQILDGLNQIMEGNLSYQIPKEKLGGDNLHLADSVNHIGEGLSMAVEQRVKDERLKSDLITNVSHDIKTPLTSIINYVDLLKREDIQNERARNYIAILENKSQRLKHLTDDLVEASKISSGNIKLEFTRITFQELLNQTNGEFCEKFESKGLQMVVNMPKEPVVIEADGRRLWRIIENLYNNAAKYAMPNTRVYVELTVVGHMVRFSIKNISEQPLNIQAEELTERFIRGDVARSTEGSGLGLSIAKNLTELQKGTFDIYLDGDLFKITIIFPEAEVLKEEEEMQMDFEVGNVDN